MSIPTETVWACDGHTVAKHHLLRRYLAAWFPILAKYHGRVVYMDGFAGPGEYEGGQEGSPIIALKIAIAQQQHLAGKEVVFAFIENDQSRLANLESIVSTIEKPANFKIHCINRRFDDLLTEQLNGLEESGQDNAPIFAFIDPFGFSGVPFSLLSRLLNQDRTEAFVYFARDSVNRFLEVESVEHHMKALFGLDDLVLPKGPEKRVQKIKLMYEGRLREIAKFVGCFTMINQQNKPLYDLFFISNNSKGYLKMKEAMWAVDADGGFYYSDRENHLQPSLFQPDPIPKVESIVIERAAGRKDIKYEYIETWLIEQTIYLPTHLKQALKRLEQQQRIYCHPQKSDGKKRRAGSFPEGTIIDF